MKFLTVGTQLPFDRLVKHVDAWARARSANVYAQVGPTEFEPRFITAVRRLEPRDFGVKMREATAVISHAGMGTILTALQLGKPIVVMPRLAKFKEHRNDHQLATAKQLIGRPGILVAMNEEELASRLDALESMTAFEGVAERASGELIEAIRAFIDNDATT